MSREPGGVAQTTAWIGYGNFGRFAVPLLAPLTRVIVVDPDASAPLPPGVTTASLADAASVADALVLATPVSAMQDVLRAVGPLLRPGTLVVDVGSVKQQPMELMEACLPESVSYAGTHPLFGPQSGAAGIAGLRIALCRGRIADDRYDALRSLLADTLALTVLEPTPDEHDQAMAYVQGLTHLIGWAFRELDPPETPLATVAYERMVSLRANVADDTPELFETIQRFNPHVGAVRTRFLEALRGLIPPEEH